MHPQRQKQRYRFGQNVDSLFLPLMTALLLKKKKRRLKEIKKILKSGGSPEKSYTCFIKLFKHRSSLYKFLPSKKKKDTQVPIKEGTCDMYFGW